MKAVLSVACVSLCVSLCVPVLASDPPREWDPALVEGGFMFKDAEAFRQYLLKADSVVVGHLTAWDGEKGKVRLRKVYRGTPGKEPSFAYSGGLVRSAEGDKVLVVLGSKEDRVVLHSFCAASGLFPLKGDLERIVEKLLVYR
jgi:hypothetical protein